MTIDTKELRKLAEAATGDHWSYDGSYVCPARFESGTKYVETWRSVADCNQPENTRFVAAANPATILALLDELAGYQQGAKVEADAADEARAEVRRLKIENEALRKDAARLDRLDLECEAYGFDYQEGNRWAVDGPFVTVRDAIDAAIAKDPPCTSTT